MPIRQIAGCTFLRHHVPGKVHIAIRFAGFLNCLSRPQKMYAHTAGCNRQTASASCILHPLQKFQKAECFRGFLPADGDTADPETKDWRSVRYRLAVNTLQGNEAGSKLQICCFRQTKIVFVLQISFKLPVEIIKSKRIRIAIDIQNMIPPACIAIWVVCCKQAMVIPIGEIMDIF